MACETDRCYNEYDECMVPWRNFTEIGFGI